MSKIIKQEKSALDIRVVKRSVPFDLFAFKDWYKELTELVDVASSIPISIELNDDGEIITVDHRKNLPTFGEYGQVIYNSDLINRALPTFLECLIDTCNTIFEIDSKKRLNYLTIHPPIDKRTKCKILSSIIPPTDISGTRLLMSLGHNENFEFRPADFTKLTHLSKEFFCESGKGYRIDIPASASFSISFDYLNHAKIKEEKGRRSGTLRKDPHQRFIVVMDFVEDIEGCAEFLTKKFTKIFGKDTQRLKDIFEEMSKTDDGSTSNSQEVDGYTDIVDKYHGKIEDTFNKIKGLLPDNINPKIKTAINKGGKIIENKTTIKKAVISIAPKHTSLQGVKDVITKTIDSEIYKHNDDEVNDLLNCVENEPSSSSCPINHADCGNDEEE